MLEFSLIFMDIFLFTCDHLIHELNIVSLLDVVIQSAQSMTKQAWSTMCGLLASALVTAFIL
jgi:hypothetical protein